MTLIETVLDDFGQNVSHYPGAYESLMNGYIQIKDLETIPSNQIEIALIKKNSSIVQSEEARLKTQEAYCMFDSSLNIKEGDIIETISEYFIVHQVTLKNNNISGAVGSEPGYKRADLELYQEK